MDAVCRLISPFGFQLIRHNMLPDSTMLDEKTGDIHLSGDLYEKVLALPIDTDANGMVVQNHVKLAVETKFPILDDHGMASATLFKDRIQVESPHYSRVMSLDDVPYLGIERNNKLQLFLRDSTMAQLTFSGSGSALQWQNTIRTLQKRQASAT